MILVSETSGVPTMSTPRTSMSGRPSAKTSINDQRLHLEGLRLAASGERKAAGDIVDQQAERLALPA